MRIASDPNGWSGSQWQGHGLPELPNTPNDSARRAIREIRVVIRVVRQFPLSVASAPGSLPQNANRFLTVSREDLRQLVRRHDLQLIERALVRTLVGAPPAELRRVSKAIPLHVIVRDLNHQLGTERLP